jgi:Predicted hydrocarbon binding protein (contains V4R domain)
MKDNNEYPQNFSSDVDLFSSEKGIHAIDSPVKMKILSMLNKHELSFEEIVSSSGKAKSTVSVHLRGLSDAGIIGAKSDPDDSRKKIFFTTSLLLGGASKGERLRFDIDEYIPEYIPGNHASTDFYRFIMSTTRVTLLNEGITIDPLLERSGVRVGKAISPVLACPDITGFINNMKRFWDDHNLGHIEMADHDPLTITIYNCFECVNLPVIGRPVCAFESGVLSAVFSEYFGEPRKAVETGCYAMGDSFCRFIIKGPEAK